MACAQTGSGKTVSHFPTYILPSIQTVTFLNFGSSQVDYFSELS